MAARSKKAAEQAVNAAAVARSHPYVQRILNDDELRENLRRAYESAHKAYGRAAHDKRPTARALAENKKVRKELRKTTEALQDVRASLQAKPKKRHLGRKLVILIAGAALALALSESLRNKVLDALFGAEEEFDYSSTTAPATPPPADNVPA